MPLLVNLQPAGEYLGEDYHRAGGVPAVVAELIKAKRIHEDALTVNGKTIGENCKGKFSWNRDVIKDYRRADQEACRLQDAERQSVRFGDHEDVASSPRNSASAICRTRRIPTPSRPRPSSSTGLRTITSTSTIPKLGIDENTILFMRGTGPLGYPGAAEVVNMRAPGELLKKGMHSLPCVGDGRQSGTSGSPSILNASPEAAAGGGLALLKNGDRCASTSTRAPPIS